MKKHISMLLAAALLFACLLVNAGAEEKITTDKTVYEEDEAINITAYGSGTDWVGLYLRDDTVGSDVSIYWYYVARDGNVSGETKEILAAEYSNSQRSDYFGIPAGEYTIYLCADDAYEVIASVDITVQAPQQVIRVPSAPGAVYTRSTDKAGYANGTVTITSGVGKPDEYIMYWGDADGEKLEGFAPFLPVKYTAATTTATILPDTLIPQGARYLLVYAKNSAGESSSCAKCAIEDEAVLNSLGDVKYELQIMSDTHITAQKDSEANINFQNALREIKALSPSSVGVFIAGDLTDTGYEAEYDSLLSILAEAGADTPDIYPSMGNHDLYGHEKFEDAVSLFMSKTGINSDVPYYDKWIEGIHFIFLSSTAKNNDNAVLSDECLDWLEQKLAENRDEYRPIYLLLHQSVKDTIAGGFEYQKWWGLDNSRRFESILQKYPEVMMFNGHSHWLLSSPYSMHPRDDMLPSIFNTSSCAYLWDDGAMETNVGINGSECYYVYGYEDCVILRGRDLKNGLWLPSAQFIVDYTNPDKASAETQDDTQSVQTQAEETNDAESGAVSVVGIVAAAVAAAAVIIIVLVIVIKKKRS